jgi:hypothetical protein
VKLTKVNYEELNSRQQEIFNFQKVAALLADYGYNCIKLADDWQGADFLAYHKDQSGTLKVQLKSRLSIAKKYLEKSIYIAFPLGAEWFLVEHDRLVDLINMHASWWMESQSWREHGLYHSKNPNKKLMAALAEFRL